MNGPTKKASEYGKRAERLETLATIAAVTVVLGLLIESGKELRDAAVKLVLPSREVQGNLLVTLAVAAEAFFGWRALRWSRKAEIEAEERVSAAERQTAEANLERVRLEARVAPRFLTSEQRAALAQDLAPAELKRLDIFLYGATPEGNRLCGQIGESLKSAGWSFQTWTVYGQVALAGLLISVLDSGDFRISESAVVLLRALEKTELDVVTPCKWFESGAVPDGVIVPTWRSNEAAPIQLHIGMKPYITSRPVTPPQA